MTTRQKLKELGLDRHKLAEFFSYKPGSFDSSTRRKKIEAGVLKVVEHLNTEKTANSDWVAVSENKPEVGQWLLVYAPSGRHIAWYNGFQFEDRADYNIEGVTHWMQIPEPPCA